MFKPDAVQTWIGIGTLESGHALEVLRVCKLLPHDSYDDALIEGGPNGEAFPTNAATCQSSAF